MKRNKNRNARNDSPQKGSVMSKKQSRDDTPDLITKRTTQESMHDLRRDELLIENAKIVSNMDGLL